MKQLTYPVRRMQEAYDPEGAKKYAAEVMDTLALKLGADYTTYAALQDSTRGMTEPFSQAAELLGMAYADHKGRKYSAVSAQILDASHDVPKVISLMSNFPLESGDKMIFERMAKHAQRVEELRHTPREQVNPEKLEALYHEMRTEMTEVLSIVSRIRNWGVDSTPAAPPKPFRGRAAAEVPRRTDSAPTTGSARPERSRGRR